MQFKQQAAAGKAAACKAAAAGKAASAGQAASACKAASAAAGQTKTYIPPALRATNALSIAKKKEPRKEFSACDPSAFPALGETLHNNVLNFSSAAKKKIEQETIMKVEVLPGWVHIRKQSGMHLSVNNKNVGTIEYKYGASINHDMKEDREAKKVGRIIFKYRLWKEQYARDMDVLRLGDLSEFYGEPSLAEIYDAQEEEYRTEKEKMKDQKETINYSDSEME